ncbi:hypothetical protein R1flu_000345 [Riccia fluitans]|uniref:HORMA domain-containing protein n=1 Tax=Riccia fluitans TaxID=41844 RepID=A0ABD1Y087_9MARC
MLRLVVTLRSSSVEAQLVSVEQPTRSMGTAQLTRDIITLKGSAAIVSEFFCYAVNSILFQRGIYPAENFARVKKYGLTMLICEDERVKTFINTVTKQMADWLETGSLERVVLVVASIASGEVLERWSFNIETDKEVTEKGIAREKPDKEIMTDIQGVMRQITSSVTFLPHLEEPCTFDLLVYTPPDSKVPPLWGESDARLINNPQVVKLRSVDTKVHRVDAMVAYKFDG